MAPQHQTKPLRRPSSPSPTPFASPQNPTSFFNTARRPNSTRHSLSMKKADHDTKELNEPLLAAENGSYPPPNQSSSSPSVSFNSRFLLPTLLIASVVVGIAVFASPIAFSTLPRFLRPPPPTIGKHDTQPGFSIVAACANRQNILNRALKSWLHVQNATEIVIIDWTSDPPLQPVINTVLKEENYSARDFPNVKVIRVENETEWVLSRAYNLGLRHATRETVFKTDCDYIIEEKALEAHPINISRNEFYSGYYMNSRNANELHLNGALILSQRLFWSIGGYDERIITYGFDDGDLYNRLEKSGAQRLNVSYEYVSHIKHGDLRRAQTGVKFPKVQIDVNSLLLDKIGHLWDSTDKPTEYGYTDDGALIATYIPPSLESMVKPEELKEVTALAMGRRLHDEYNVPWGVISSMDTPNSEKFLAGLMAIKKESNFDEVLDDGPPPRYVLIHVQNGLGNRLRCMGSSVAYAKQTNRVPLLIWEKDIHFNALFSDIFDASSVDFGVINEFQPQWPLIGGLKYDAAWGTIDYYNYLLEEEKDKKLKQDHSRNIYFKSASVMRTNWTSWDTANEEINAVKVRDEITNMAKKIYAQDSGKMGGVHIRNRSVDDDIVGYDGSRDLYHKKDVELLDKWRSTTKMENFIGPMQGFLKNGTVDKFFVASDTVEVCEKLKSKFPDGQIVYIPRDCDDRGAHCEKYAMADLLVLAQTKLMLGSTWSSFSEAAMRLGAPKALLAGKFSYVFLILIPSSVTTTN